MCLYPKFIKNPKYKPNRKNNYHPPICTDGRVLMVPIGCGKCIECKKQKARGWQTRLNEQLKVEKNAYFVTLTFSCEELEKLKKETKLNECNAIAGVAVRRFLERWRKAHKKSIKHWLVTELGHNGTERIHLHGILFADIYFNNAYLEKIWKYGITYVGDYCNARTINYIIKYVLKIDVDHKNYEPQIFCSAGLGRNYVDQCSSKQIHQFRGEQTIEYYRLDNGAKINLPTYYRNHFFNEQQREQLWTNLLDKHERFVLGVKIENVDTLKGQETYNKVLKKAQETNKEMGYGDDSEEWKKQEYNVTMRMLNKKDN